MKLHAPLWILLVAVGAALSSCNDQPASAGEVLSMTAEKKAPPLALFPLADPGRSDTSWNLSEELTAQIHHRLAQRRQVRLVDPDLVKRSMKRAKNSPSPFSADISWMHQMFGEHRFVAFMELVEHEEIPLAPRRDIPLEKTPSELNISVRVRVVDVRSEIPRVVLQEVVSVSHAIPRQLNKANFERISPGGEGFYATPLGIAHEEICKEIASRIEKYTLLGAGE